MTIELEEVVADFRSAVEQRYSLDWSDANQSRAQDLNVLLGLIQTPRIEDYKRIWGQLTGVAGARNKSITRDGTRWVAVSHLMFHQVLNDTAGVADDSTWSYVQRLASGVVCLEIQKMVNTVWAVDIPTPSETTTDTFIHLRKSINRTTFTLKRGEYPPLMEDAVKDTVSSYRDFDFSKLLPTNKNSAKMALTAASEDGFWEFFDKIMEILKGMEELNSVA